MTLVAGTTAPDLAADFALLTAAVREAGALALSYFGADVKVWRKKHGDPVSEADIAVNDLLRERLCSPRPGYGWLSEESDDDAARFAAARVWTVDPIDGTRAFLDGTPEFTVSVALVVDREPAAAIVFNPASDEFFAAVRGGGASLNGAAIAVVRRTSLAGASVLTKPRAFERALDPAAFGSTEAVESGSIAYRLALTAAGRFDATVSLSAKSDWDVAASDLLMAEAGGRITTARGEPLVYNEPDPIHPSVIAAGPPLHAELVRQFAGAVRR